MDYSTFGELIDTEPEEAYEQLKKIYEKDESERSNAELLWRMAKACMLWSNSMDKKNPKKKALIYEGRDYATAAYAANPDNFEALRWTAVLLGAATEFMGAREKLEQGKVFKLHLDKAISINPKEFTLLHLRGRFSYEVSNLSWIEKKVCNALFSAVPECTVEESLADFLEAERCAPFVWAENLLFVSRCYVLKKQKELAAKYLQMVEEIPDPDDAVKEGIVDVRCMITKSK